MLHPSDSEMIGSSTAAGERNRSPHLVNLLYDHQVRRSRPRRRHAARACQLFCPRSLSACRQGTT